MGHPREKEIIDHVAESQERMYKLGVDHGRKMFASDILSILQGLTDDNIKLDDINIKVHDELNPY